MLLGTHPIPARSPAEREGQKEKMRLERKGDRGGEEKEGRGVCGWTMGISRWNDWGEETEKKWGG